jgi:hypothetical protein
MEKESEKEGEREKEGEIERDGKNGCFFERNDRCLGTLLVIYYLNDNRLLEAA